MREVLFKDLTSVNDKKKDILLREIFQKDGIVATTERRYFYFIKDITPLENGADIEKWIEEKNKALARSKRRHFHILKEHSDEHGEERLVCKVAGTFYAIIGGKIYTVAFLHAFKVILHKAAIEQ